MISMEEVTMWLLITLDEEMPDHNPLEFQMGTFNLGSHWGL